MKESLVEYPFAHMTSVMCFLVFLFFKCIIIRFLHITFSWLNQSFLFILILKYEIYSINFKLLRAFNVIFRRPLAFGSNKKLVNVLVLLVFIFIHLTYFYTYVSGSLHLPIPPTSPFSLYLHRFFNSPIVAANRWDNLPRFASHHSPSISTCL